MAFKQKINPITGQFNLVQDATTMTFKEAVASVSNLPPTGNSIGDARFVSDTGNLYIWDGSVWQNQGDIIDVSWNSIIGKPTSTPTQIDNAVSSSHAAHSDDQDLSGKEDVSNKSTDVALGNSDTLYPSQNAVMTYVNNKVYPLFTTYYFTGYESDIGGFYLLDTTPQFGNQVNDLVTLPQGVPQYFPKKFATAELGTTFIPAGIWHFFIYRKVNSSAGATLMYFEIHSRTIEGVETLLFTVNMGEINDTVATLQQLVYAHPSFVVNPTDRLVIKARGSASAYGNTNIEYYFSGNSNTYSHIFRH
jgi:hypothetical protein